MELGRQEAQVPTGETAPTSLLLVDDEATLREPLAEYLTRQGFVVREAESAAAARTILVDTMPDLALVDIMMPGEDGLSLCRHLVEARKIPVILLTAKSEAMDRIIGLEIGADDYVPKPFEPRELVARIRSVLRRTAKDTSASSVDDEHFVYQFEGWELDPLKRRLTDPEGALIAISTAEFRMLKALCDHPGRYWTAIACSTWCRAAKRICSIARSITRSAACAARSRWTAATPS